MSEADVEYRGYYINVQSSEAAGEQWRPEAVVAIYRRGALQTTPVAAGSGALFDSEVAADTCALALAKKWIDDTLAGEASPPMTDLDREQLMRECADTLEALNRDQRLDGIAELADALRVLGPPYRFHGELMHGALRDGHSNAIVWHLIHVLELLERGT